MADTMSKEETIEQLKTLSEALKEKEENELFLQQYPTFQSYEDATLSKPQKMVYLPERPPVGYMERAEQAVASRRSTFIVLVIVSCILFALGIISAILLSMIWEGLSILSLFFFVLGAGTLIGGLIVRGRIPGWQKQVSDMQEQILTKNKRMKAEVDRYNNGEYVRLMAEYEKDLTAASEKYQSIMLRTTEEKNKTDKIIESMQGLISEKYYPAIDDIIALLEDGRADTIKEALNIYCMSHGIM